ncbi:hypothetical protein [Acinetobacter baumannii]|uniref:hypothetical protein n=1 Tax=Acinetobacter baumannii TaxID=470 RepID=UPI00226C75A4
MINLANQREALIAEVEVFKKDSMELWFVPDLAASYTNRDFFSYSIIEDNQVFFMIEQTRQLWEFWNKAKDHNLPKGSVLIALYTTNFTEPLSYQGSAFLKLPKFP